MTKRISVARLRERLAAKDEFALLDVREQGVHYQGHPFFAASLPLSRLELIPRLLSWKPQTFSPVRTFIA